jgi:hypothetical protein
MASEGFGPLIRAIHDAPHPFKYPPVGIRMGERGRYVQGINRAILVAGDIDDGWMAATDF